MKAFTNEGWAGLITLLVNVVGVILKLTVDGDWVEAIPLIQGVASAVGMLIVWILSRQTKETISSLTTEVKRLGG